MGCTSVSRLAYDVVLIATVALILVAWASLGARADGTSLTVAFREPGPRISPMLWGVFFEEINHAGDGGIYAECVRNRSFEDAEEPQSWSLVTSGAAAGSMTLDDTHPLSDANRRALRLEITRADGGRVGVANAGYWGIAVKEGEEYALSLYARCSRDFMGPLVVSLEHAAGLVYGQAVIEGLTEEWKRFTYTLTANRTDASARLVISASAPGAVWLDTVSLFPKNTWKGRPNGLRPDLAEMLAALQPSFVRFPGGCFVEGDVLENAFRWKETVGDIAARPGHWNLWGYRSTDGLGYHEYLQMCEDLGAAPMFVINCGMAHAGNVPLDELEPWVQDALDAIEYANGPTTSPWGAQRANSGHPQPFGLKYIEIGNENGGPAYEERYARFHHAIKSRYPDIQLIADVPVSSRQPDILDEHYYSSPEWFVANATRYDTRERSGPKIFVGEYACTQQCGQGNLRAALAEAAFMTGLERNSDLVVMAAYAPLFVNVNDRRWNPDAICFDSSSVYGTPSYYVQRLFSKHRGNVVLPTKLVVETGALPTSGGPIGVATWNTQAEFSEVTVSRGDEALFAADFSGGAPGWRVIRGEWSAQGGAYRQTGGGEDLRAVAGDPTWTDYTYRLKARKLGGAEGFLIMFRVRDDDNWYWWNLGGWGNVRHAIEKCVGGSKTILGDSVPGQIETGRWYDVRIEVRGSRIQCYLDGRLVHDVEDSGPPPMTAVASRVDATGEVILKVVNTSAAAHDTEVRLEGASKVAPEGTAVILTANSLDDENSLTHPTRVAPVTRRISGLGRAFRYTFPAHSLTILRIGAD